MRCRLADDKRMIDSSPSRKMRASCQLPEWGTRTSPVGTGSRPGLGTSAGYSKRPNAPNRKELPPWAANQFNSAASWRAASGGEPNSINRFVVADSQSVVPSASASRHAKLSTCSSFLLRSSFGFRNLNRLLH